MGKLYRAGRAWDALDEHHKTRVLVILAFIVYALATLARLLFLPAVSE